MKKAERQDLKEQLLSHKNNLKKSWEVMNKIINKKRTASVRLTKIVINGHEIEKDSQIADHFIEFFTNIGSQLDNKIPKTKVAPLS